MHGSAQGGDGLTLLRFFLRLGADIAKFISIKSALWSPMVVRSLATPKKIRLLLACPQAFAEHYPIFKRPD